MLASIWKFFKKPRPGALVLMYHRVEAVQQDPWDLCVSPENFSEHLQVLEKDYQVVTMNELVKRMEAKENLDRLVAITFDDGYLDNYTNAKPLLAKYKSAASFYLTSAFENKHPYWWDELESIILNSESLPGTFFLTIHEGTEHTFSPGNDATLTPVIIQQNADWRYGKPLTNQRLKIYYEIWALLKTMSVAEQKRILIDLKKNLGITAVKTPPLMTLVQVAELARSPLFEIGSHTVNHPALGTLSREEQQEEIFQNKQLLQTILSKPVTGIAFPYGHYNEDTPSVVKSLSFGYAVTTEESPVYSEHSLYEIPRFQVKNMDGSSFQKELTKWLKGS